MRRHDEARVCLRVGPTRNAERFWPNVMLGLLLAVNAQAAPPPSAQVEINYLLSAVAQSDCEFYRNGTWYDAKAAAAHLRDKYEFLVTRNSIQNSGDFIEKAATKSSISGLAYAIRCQGVPTVSSHEWLVQVLAKYRQSQKDPESQGPGK
jgi:hypothetical protein